MDSGQLGDGTFIDRYSPVQVSGLTNVNEIKAGDFHTCALKTDGTVWCWGRNEMTMFDPGFSVTLATAR